jgi:hypothetical protein
MNTSPRNPVRALWIVILAALLLMVTAAAAFGRGTTASRSKGSEAAVDAVSTAYVGAGSSAMAPDAAIGMPTWCCPSSGTVPGLTTYGQAVVKERGQAARDAAIAEAVNDATDQAHAAADAAGITLGAIIDMQVSATPDYYAPLPEANAGSTGIPTTPNPGGDLVKGIPFVGNVSVTMTWALG